jgi:hypothetical protein
MSSNEQVLNNGQQAITNYDVAKIFLWNPRYDKNSYTNNSSYDPITLRAGTVMGRISATGIVVPLESNASDGSQFPVGILGQDITLDEGETANVSLCVAGDVAEDKVIFVRPGDNLETVVSSRRLKDRIAADTVGINLVPCDDLTGYDNQ